MSTWFKARYFEIVQRDATLFDPRWGGILGQFMELVPTKHHDEFG